MGRWLRKAAKLVDNVAEKLPDGDASVLDTIKDLTEGEKVLAAKELAT
jgi:predicted alpha-1,6-mannanase (GH76 family)